MKKMKEDNVDGEDMKEKPKNIIINLTISLGVILATIAFAGLSGSDLVIKTAWYILIIPVSYTHLTLPTKRIV